MTAEQRAAFCAFVQEYIRHVTKRPSNASFGTIIDDALKAFGIDYLTCWDSEAQNRWHAHNRLLAAARRQAIAILKRGGYRPTEARARAVAYDYVKQYVAWGQADRLDAANGGFGSYAYHLFNGQARCRVHDTWEERPGYLLVHELYLQPCCFHFAIAELIAEVEGNQVVQLSLGLAS